MSREENYNKAAYSFVDMWQKNVAAMMNDGDFIRTLLKTMQNLDINNPGGENNAQQKQQSSSFADAASAANDAAVNGILRRLAAIEERLAFLERSFAGYNAGAARKSAKSVAGAKKQSQSRSRSPRGSKKSSD
ncbi:MAG: hypothetical protein WCL30_01790 [Pseudomonadota bacterium]